MNSQLNIDPFAHMETWKRRETIRGLTLIMLRLRLVHIDDHNFIVRHLFDKYKLL